MMEKVVTRVVTEKYVLGSPGENLPMVILWDGIQQGVIIRYFNRKWSKQEVTQP